MYIPKAFHQTDQAELLAFMRANSFITLVSTLDGVPFASHIPIAIRVEGEAITLIGHVARANPHWHAFASGETLAIFTGPHAYISPSLYEQHESVPTWNYIAVHAYGQPEIVTLAQDRARLEALVDTLVDSYEAAYQQQWAELSERFRTGMLNGIVGFELPVTRLEGKYKMSQNRSPADQQRVATALRHRTDPAAQELGQQMQDNLTMVLRKLINTEVVA